MICRDKCEAGSFDYGCLNSTRVPLTIKKFNQSAERDPDLSGYGSIMLRQAQHKLDHNSNPP
ncbi:MAG: hypothetical protein HPY57_09090 [Ignavibacteria bacterium]|nr:hypothetical protein [Ignavibacteria bacterium]